MLQVGLAFFLEDLSLALAGNDTGEIGRAGRQARMDESRALARRTGWLRLSVS